MTLLSQIINEALSRLRPGIYDLHGNPIKGIYGSETINRFGEKNSRDVNYLMASQLVSIFNKNAEKKITVKFIGFLRNSSKVYFKPSGYYIDENGKKIDTYSLNRLYKIMLFYKNDGTPVTTTEGKLMFSNDGDVLYDEFFNSPLSKKKNKREIERQKWMDNLEHRSRYDTSEKYDSNDEDKIR